MVQPLEAVVQVKLLPPEVAVAVNAVTEVPPFEEGFPQVTSIAVFAPNASTFVGVPGRIAAGVTGELTATLLSPFLFLATTLKV